MKVARKHIIAAIEVCNIRGAGKLMTFPKYTIKAYPHTGKDKKLGEFGWTITVLPRAKD